MEKDLRLSKHTFFDFCSDEPAVDKSLGVVGNNGGYSIKCDIVLFIEDYDRCWLIFKLVGIMMGSSPM